MVHFQTRILQLDLFEGDSSFLVTSLLRQPLTEMCRLTAHGIRYYKAQLRGDNEIIIFINFKQFQHTKETDISNYL